MHPLAGRNLLRCYPDRLAVLANALAATDVPHGDLVTQLDGLAELDFAVCQNNACSGLQAPHGNTKVVVPMERDDVNR